MRKPLQLKLVMVGDNCAGKTSLLIRYTTKQYQSDQVPNIFENNSQKITLDGTEGYLGLWDTCVEFEYDRLRPLNYPQTNVFLLCYAIAQHYGSDCCHTQIKEFWVPEVKRHCPEVPLLLVGTKSDLRREPGKRQHPLMGYDEGVELAKEIGAVGYYECSAMSGEGVEEVFDRAAELAYKHYLIPDVPPKRPKQQCIVL